MAPKSIVLLLAAVPSQGTTGAVGCFILHPGSDLFLPPLKPPKKGDIRWHIITHPRLFRPVPQEALLTFNTHPVRFVFDLYLYIYMFQSYLHKVSIYIDCVSACAHHGP